MGMVFNKVMGLIVCAIAFEFLMNGFVAFLPGQAILPASP
jgi:small neutral amino acid transporter SnatA (MarC family)